MTQEAGVSVGLYSVPSPPTKSLQPRDGSYSWLGQPSTGPPPGLCLKPDLRGRTGVWTKERLQSWLEALDPHASFWTSRLCIREQKLTLCQDLGSLQHQRCSSRREGLQKRAHLALQSQAGARRELPCTDPPHGTHRSLFQGHWSVSSHSECPLAVQEL